MATSTLANERISQGPLEESKQAAAPANAESMRLNECRESVAPWKTVNETEWWLEVSIDK
jgi:hypothetical protein